MSRSASKRKLIVSALVPFVILIGIVGYIFANRTSYQAPNNSDHQAQNQNPQPSTSQNSAFNKSMYSLETADSIWVVVNKKRPLPSDYVPSGLVNHPLGGQMRPEAAKALDTMVSAAKQEGIGFKVISAYRSYSSQASVYNGYVNSDGQADADTYSARPGHSEHQTGLAIDLGNQNGNCDLDICFGDTATGKWLAMHAHEYGFIVRYPNGKQAVVGYQYEPWHIRYVGPELSGELYKNGQTMEEFFSLPAAANY